MTTIRDVAELAGVSQATVSRAINGTHRVSHDKKLNIEKAMAQLGYQPRVITHNASLSRTGCVGVVVPELGGPFYSTILDELEQQLRRFGYHVIVSASTNTELGQKESVDLLINRRVDALILHTHQLSDDYLISLQASGMPLVLINRCVQEISENCVNVDNELGAKVMTEYLIKMGHENIALITGPLSKVDARARLQGYRSALTEAGLSYDESLIAEAQFTEESGSSAMSRILNRKVPFSAVFACNDYMAVGAREALLDADISVPEQVSLVGFDDMYFARYLTPQLTTVDYPIEQMCLEAVQLIIQKLCKKKSDVNFKLSPSLVVRQSVKDIHTYR